MPVIPFRTSRFTQGDVSLIVELCYRLMGRGVAGGWARHTSNQGSDIIRILNCDDDFAKYTFDREKTGRYRVFGSEGALIAQDSTIDGILSLLPKAA